MAVSSTQLSVSKRRQLAQIKRMITHPRRALSSPLDPRLNFAMREFRLYSPFFRCIREIAVFFRKSQQDLDSWKFYAQRPRENNEKEMRIKRATVTIKIEKKGQLKKSLKKIPTLALERRQQHKWTAEPFSALFSPLVQELDKFGISWSK